MEGIIRAWGKILAGRQPNLSIEITRECPLRCPGCYAYGDEHLGGGQTLRTLNDRKGAGAHRRHSRAGRSVTAAARVAGRRRTPRAVSRARRAAATTGGARALRAGRDERGETDSRGVGVDPRLQICVSIDGLQPEHDARRAPATYDRILKHIDGHQITVHCTVTRQQTRARGLHRGIRSRVVEQRQRAIDLAEPLYAAGRRDSPERLTPADRRRGRRNAARRYASTIPSCRCRDRCSMPTWIRLPRRRSASLRERPRASRRTCRRRSRRASSAAHRTARAAAAWRQPVSPRLGVIASAA